MLRPIQQCQCEEFHLQNLIQGSSTDMVPHSGIEADEAHKGGSVLSDVDAKRLVDEIIHQHLAGRKDKD
jgi:hypothetical protein